MDVAADGTVDLAVAVVNLLTPGRAHGRAHEVPAGADRRVAVVSLLADRPNRARQWATADHAELDRLEAAAGALRRVFELASQGDVDAAADALNGLMRSADARPQLTSHDGQPWHLHLHPEAAAPSDGVVAQVATALAWTVAGGGADRLGICTASACDRVYVDASRNASRRFCSAACQNRTKAAAFRARRSG
ncbi:MAG: CGNR zinc finger domain-containing protein [Actinomycetes bacterium]